MSKPSQHDSDRNNATLLALVLVLAVAGGLLLLTSLVMGFMLGVGIVLIVFGFACLCLIHYVTWGRMLERQAKLEEEPVE